MDQYSKLLRSCAKLMADTAKSLPVDSIGARCTALDVKMLNKYADLIEDNNLARTHIHALADALL